MAKDVITRFRLETTQYDSALRSSAEGLKEVVNMARLAGKDFDGFSQKAIDAAKALGDLDTGATNNRDKLKELVAAYNKMAATYNAMSDSMKQDEGGKALASSLDRLKERIGETKKEMYGLDSQGKQTGGMMDALKDKFVVNLDAVKLFNIGLKAAEGALNVMKDAFMASEANVDLWGRTMEASEALYEGFCNALNRSDFTGFLSRIDEITSAATEAYNALDELGTYRTIQKPANAQRAAEETRLRTMLRTGRYIAPTNGAKSAYGLKEGDVLTPEARAGYQRSLQRLMAQGVAETRRDISKTQNSVDKLYNEIASTSGISRADFKNTIQNWDTYQSTFKDVQNFNDWNSKNVPWFVKAKPDAYALYVASHNPYYSSRTLAWRDFKDSGDKFNRAQSLAEESYSLSSQLYGEQMSNYRSLNAGGGRSGGGRSGGGKGGRRNKNYEPQTQVLLFCVDMPWWKKKDALPQMEKGLQSNISMLDIDPSLKIQSASWAERGQKNPEVTKIADKMDETSKVWSDMGGSINSIVAGVESLGIEVPSGFKKMIGLTQTVSTIMSGISSLLLLINSTQMAAAIIPFNRGGMVRAAMGYTVPGNYGFDAVPAMLTSGEVVLNRAQQGVLASQLADNARSMGTPSARVSGEDIYIAVSHYMQRRGYGEFAVAR